MKKNLCSVLFVAWVAASAQANLIPNGSFEAQPVGASVGSGSGNFDDYTTFTGWRVSDGNATNDSFSATIVSTTDKKPGAGTKAMRLAINNNSDSLCWLDQWGLNMQTPVSYGKTYFYSFDAAWVAGDTFDNLWVGIFEFDGNGNYITRDTAPGFLSVVSTNFTTYSYTWTPTAANCARMGFVFVPETTRPKAATLDLDNVVVTAVDTSNLASAFGDFQGVAPGTSVSQTTDATTVPGWLIANGNPGSDFFTATIIPATGRNAGAGTKALQFAITNNTDTACYLESQMPIPVSYGTKYLFSFDAAWVSGGTFDNLWVGIKEFDSSGNFIIRDQLLAGFLSVTSTNYATYRYTWTPTVANRANIHFIFYPEATRTDPATFSLANIRFETVNDSRKVRRAAAQ